MGSLEVFSREVLAYGVTIRVREGMGDRRQVCVARSIRDNAAVVSKL